MTQMAAANAPAPDEIASAEFSEREPETGQNLLPEVQQRIEVIQWLLRHQGNDHYGSVQPQAAQTLGISIRSVQRLMKARREQGIAGLMLQPRRDCGTARISEDWQQFIVKTY